MLYVETSRYLDWDRCEHDYEWGAIVLKRGENGVSSVQGVFEANSVQELAALIIETMDDVVDYVRDINGNITDCGCLSLAECMELTYTEHHWED